MAKLPIETYKESAPLFLFFAEFRKYSYKDRNFGVPGLYDDLGPEKYDATKFINILEDVIRLAQEKNPDLCFRFVSLLEKIMRDAVPEEKQKYDKLFLDYCKKYFIKVYSHSIFQLIYQAINDKLNSDGENYDQWYDLYINCLETENKFYQKIISDSENKKNEKYRGDVLVAIFL